MAKLNRANQIKSNVGDVKKSVTLYDVDYAMMSYLEETVLPKLDENGVSLPIPVVYGNSERWNSARREGVYRDAKGKIQLPIMMIRRTTISKDEAVPMLKQHVSYATVTKWSKDNRYDRFSTMGGVMKPKYELYNITMPQYVEIAYECMVWTNYTEHLNAVIEQLNFSSQYWGHKDKFQFYTDISDYTVINEVGEGNQRINRVEFNIAVKAHLLPETYNGQPTTKKAMSIKRLVVTTEVDVTGNGRLEGILTTPSPYYDNKDLIDFLSLNGSKSGFPIVDNTITFTNIKPIPTPSTLQSVITGGVTIGTDIYDIKVYINGVRYYYPTHFSASSTTSSLTINFNSIELGFNVNSSDEIIITGKFIEV